MLFTNRALAEAEALTGKTVTQLLDRAAIGMTDLANLTLVGMEAARRDTDPRRARYTIADAWDLIDKVGFMPVLRAVTESLVAVTSGKRAGTPRRGQGGMNVWRPRCGGADGPGVLG